MTSERVSSIFVSMEEKGLGAVVSKNDNAFGFIKAVPPPIIITQYLTEKEYVAACRTEGRSSTKLSATQWHSKMTKVFGFIKAVPPPIIITQYLKEEEYVAACRTEDRSSTKLSATQWHSKSFWFHQGCATAYHHHTVSQRGGVCSSL